MLVNDGLINTVSNSTYKNRPFRLRSFLHFMWVFEDVLVTRTCDQARDAVLASDSSRASRLRSTLIWFGHRPRSLTRAKPVSASRLLSNHVETQVFFSLCSRSGWSYPIKPCCPS